MALRIELWSRWKAFAHRLASFQARLLFGMIYFTLLAPFALLLRLTANPFRTAGWHGHEPPDADRAKSARRQF